MRLVGYSLTALGSALSLLIAAPAIGQTTVEQRQTDFERRSQACVHLDGAGSSPPAQASRPLELDRLGISIEIPENYRAMARSANFASILTPESYSYSQCMIENRVPTSIDVYSVALYLSEPTSEELLNQEIRSNRRFGVKRLLESRIVGGREAFVYIHEGMYDSLVVRINDPNRDESLVISTDISGDDELPMQETFERVLASLKFL